MEICAECGEPIGFGQGSYYKKAGDNSDIGQTFHSTCGDPLGIKASVVAERERCATKLEIAADAWIKEGADEKWPKRLINLAIQIRAGH